VSLSGLCLHYIVSFVNLLNIGSTAVQEVLNHCKVHQINAAPAERERDTGNMKRRGEEERVCVCVYVCVLGGGTKSPHWDTKI